MSTSLPEYVQYGVDLVTGQKVPLRISDVYYGDQTKIPRTPTVCVDAGGKRRELNGAPRRTLVVIEFYVFVYHYKVGSTSTNQKEADQLAEQLETLFHADAQMGGLAIDSLVTSIDSGYAERSRELFRSSRLTIEARQQEQLPSSF